MSRMTLKTFRERLIHLPTNGEIELSLDKLLGTSVDRKTFNFRESARALMHVYSFVRSHRLSMRMFLDEKEDMPAFLALVISVPPRTKLHNELCTTIMEQNVWLGVKEYTDPHGEVHEGTFICTGHQPKWLVKKLGEIKQRESAPVREKEDTVSIMFNFQPEKAFGKPIHKGHKIPVDTKDSMGFSV